MIHRRTRDRGHFGGHPRPEFMVFIAIICVLLAIAIPNLVRMQSAKKPKCIDLLAARTAGPLPAETVCPASKQPYVVVAKDGVERISCASPAGHHDSSPRFVREGTGPWRLEQFLPVYAGAPVELADARLEVKESPGRISVLVKPGVFARFVMGPLLVALLTYLTVACVITSGGAVSKQEWIDMILPALGAVAFGVFAYGALTWAGSSHEWIVERGRVTRVDYFLGRRSSEKNLEGCLGMVPSVEVGSPPTMLRLVHAPDAEGKRTTGIESIASDRKDLAQWFNRILQAP